MMGPQKNPKVLEMRASAMAACATIRAALSGGGAKVGDAADALGFLSALEDLLANEHVACVNVLYMLEHRKPQEAAAA